jgi:hypothetical protein
MIRQTLVAAMAAFGLVGGAMAQSAACPCGGPQNSRVNSLSTLLSNKTVCAAAGNESWQEYHQGAGGGTLIDWKLGPGDPVDPTEPVGTWSTSADGTASATVTHSYGSGGSYTYAMCTEPGGSYRFCSGAAAAVSGATLINGQAACGATSRGSNAKKKKG